MNQMTENLSLVSEQNQNKTIQRVRMEADFCDFAEQNLFRNRYNSCSGKKTYSRLKTHNMFRTVPILFRPKNLFLALESLFLIAFESLQIGTILVFNCPN
jgi:hypothetical protein